MKTLLKILGVVVLLFAVFMASQYVASESGEVVVVTSRGADGTTGSTRLWVVEHDGSSWIRAGQPTSQWSLRVQSNPIVTVERAGETNEYRAMATESARAAVNAEMREKYGWADWYIDALFDVGDALPYRLVPFESEG